MIKKAVSGVLLSLLLAGMIVLAFKIQPARGAGTIYIRADGSVEGTLYIVSSDNVTYVFTADINDTIIVERSNIIIDGEGYALQGEGSGAGFSLFYMSNVTIKNTNIKNSGYGIVLSGSSNSSITANNVTANNYSGIWLDSSNNTSVTANNVTANGESGILLSGSSNNNSITANNITENVFDGIALYDSSNNSVTANNIVNNGYGIELCFSSSNSVTENNITKNNDDGIWLSGSSNNNSIAESTITENNGHGIYLSDSSNNNSITANSITANGESGILLSGASNNNSMTANNITANSGNGIWLYSSSNSIIANNIVNNGYGIMLFDSSNNGIYHNNFVNNTEQVATSFSTNFWDNGYPSGGNYWSDYSGEDANNDGIGDTPYTIDVNNVDHYPLMSPWALVADLASLVVCGQNNIIYYRTFNITTASWNSWNALPGATCDSPAAAVIGNELHFVVKGMEGYSLWHGFVNLIDGGFSGWTLLSGSTPSAPALTANDTHLCLVVRGQNSLIYYRFYDCASHDWTDWSALPSGSTCDGLAATVLTNKLHIAVRGMDGYTLWHSSIDLSTSAFSGWDLVGGATESKPALTTCKTRNEVILVVRGLNNVIYRNSWTGSGWDGWSGLPTGATCDGVGATVIGETLHVVVRGMDGHTLWHGYVDLATSVFSGWTLLSGSTPSTPTLTS